MKYCSTLVVFLMLVVSAQQVAAQKLRITDTLNTWQTYGNNTECFYEGIVSLSHTDSIISGRSYRYTKYYTIHASGCFPGLVGSVCANVFIREDTAAGLVYALRLGTDTAEQVLYNYNLGLGDTIRHHYPTMDITDSVVALDSVLIHGIYHRRFDFMGTGGGWGRVYSVIEGIGCTNNPVFPAYFDMCFEYSEYVRCYMHDTEAPVFPMRQYMCMYTPTSPDYINCSSMAAGSISHYSAPLTITPNPANDHFTISGDLLRNTMATIYDATGRIVHRSPATEGKPISTAAWPPGRYLLLLHNDSGIVAKEKILVQH